MMTPKFKMLRSVLAPRTVDAIKFDLLRWRVRRRMREYTMSTDQFVGLHLGCGRRRLTGWLNVDLVESDWNVDLSAGHLPFVDAAFNSLLCQHTIEHLDMTSELLPLLTECVRVLRPGGRAWFSCPDIRKICASYVDDRCESLIGARRKRHANGEATWSLDKETGLESTPASHMMNSLFHQQGEHRNLFDLELLSWLLRYAGFKHVETCDETQMRRQLPEVPSRNDDEQSLLVMAIK